MNIAIFTEAYHPIINGVVISIETFKKELQKLGHRVYIFTPEIPGYQDIEEGIFRFFSLPYPVRIEYRLTLPLPLKIFKEFKNLKIDIIHSQHPFFTGKIALSLAKKENIPLVFTYHTQYDKYTHYVPLPQNILKKLVIVWVKNYCNQCDLIISPSERIKEMIKSYNVKKPVEVVPTGINLKEFENLDREKVRKAYNISENEKVLVFAGRLAKEKNIEFLLEIFKMISLELSDIWFLIVGGGPEEENLKNLARKMNIKNVIFTGYLPKLQVFNCFSAADIFVFSSLTETQGLVLLEAMASYLVPVVLKGPGVEEVITEGVDGFLCPPDKNYFKEKIIKLILDKNLYYKMSQAARKKAEKFSSASLAKKLENIYKSLLR